MPAGLHTHTTDTLDTLCPLTALREDREVLLHGVQIRLGFGQREASDIGASSGMRDVRARARTAHASMDTRNPPRCTH